MWKSFSVCRSVCSLPVTVCACQCWSCYSLQMNPPSLSLTSWVSVDLVCIRLWVWHPELTFSVYLSLPVFDVRQSRRYFPSESAHSDQRHSPSAFLSSGPLSTDLFMAHAPFSLDTVHISFSCCQSDVVLFSIHVCFPLSLIPPPVCPLLLLPFHICIYAF